MRFASLTLPNIQLLALLESAAFYYALHSISTMQCTLRNNSTKYSLQILVRQRRKSTILVGANFVMAIIPPHN